MKEKNSSYSSIVEIFTSNRSTIIGLLFFILMIFTSLFLSKSSSKVSEPAQEFNQISIQEESPVQENKIEIGKIIQKTVQSDPCLEDIVRGLPQESWRCNTPEPHQRESELTNDTSNSEDDEVSELSATATIRVTDFLKSLRGVGVNKIPRILEELDISPRKRLGGLGKHQRAGLRKWILAYQAKRKESWPPKAVVLVGPSGVGKGTVVNHIVRNHPQVHLSISATTRDPRPGEVDGVNYYFIDHGEFDAMIYSEALLEWAEVLQRIGRFWV